VTVNYDYIINYIIVIPWVVSLMYCLFKLRKLDVNPTARAVWAAVILFFPYLGAIAFLFITGGQKHGREGV
jgi:hypothetical protein